MSWQTAHSIHELHFFWHLKQESAYMPRNGQRKILLAIPVLFGPSCTTLPHDKEYVYNTWSAKCSFNLKVNLWFSSYSHSLAAKSSVKKRLKINCRIRNKGCPLNTYNEIIFLHRRANIVKKWTNELNFIGSFRALRRYVLVFQLILCQCHPMLPLLVDLRVIPFVYLDLLHKKYDTYR